jgi:hypothetical protein
MPHDRLTTLGSVNQERLAERVMLRLRDEAGDDPLRWVPAEAVAADLLGDATAGQLDVLRRVLFRLAANDMIEVAAFRRRAAGTEPLRTPIRNDRQTYIEIWSAQSGGLTPSGTEYGIRARETDGITA